MLCNINGGKVDVEGQSVAMKYYAEVDGNSEIKIKNGSQVAELLLLDGEPINESVAAQGPFVMNTQGESRQAFVDYQETESGGWQWES